VARQAEARLAAAWESATQPSSPIAALAASGALQREIAAWQGRLVAEALAGGGTWEAIGAALGTTRQAAWARFHSVAEQSEEVSEAVEQRVETLTRMVEDEMRSFQARLRASDESWRRDRQRLQDELREVAGRAARERKALQHDMRTAARDIRREIRRLKGDPSETVGALDDDAAVTS
jgi:hypothetical protein